MMKRSGARALLAAAGLLLSVSATPANAIPLAGDYTLIDVTSAQALSGAGVAISALGAAELYSSAALGVTLALLPVTGGDVDIPTSFAGTIEHAGSGLRLSFLGADIDFTNLVINTVTNQVVADFAIGAASGTADIFDILPCDSGPPGTCMTIPGSALIPSALRLGFSANGAALIEFGFGIPGLAGIQFGVANTAIVPVPEPGTALLLGSSLVGLAALRRGRRA